MPSVSIKETIAIFWNHRPEHHRPKNVDFVNRESFIDEISKRQTLRLPVKHVMKTKR